MVDIQHSATLNGLTGYNYNEEVGFERSIFTVYTVNICYTVADGANNFQAN